ncbi:MAG TPA: hypothetical protein VE978_12090 [Chitinophagales bacterium]|nr:hypothetical protein [Chitinophagales bacterium]
MKKSIPLLALLCFRFSQIVCAQTFEVPDTVVLKVASDYKKYEPDILADTKWLMSVPYGTQVQDWNEASEFLKKWVDGSPDVFVDYNQEIFDFSNKNPGIVTLYTAGCVRYVLENNFPKKTREEQKAGLRAMIKGYQNGAHINRDKKMEALIAADKNGKLDDWLEKHFPVDPKNLNKH